MNITLMCAMALLYAAYPLSCPFVDHPSAENRVSERGSGRDSASSYSFCLSSPFLFFATSRKEKI